MRINNIKSLIIRVGQFCLSILIIPLLFSSFEALSQDNDLGYLTVRGTVLFDEVGLGGAKVILYKNGTKKEEKITPNNGKFTFKATRDVFQLSPNDEKYIIKISKPGHVTIKHAISTKVPANKKISWPTLIFDVDLFKMPIDKVKQEKTLMSILDKPISSFSYSSRKNDFVDDRAYFSTIQARVEQLFKILEADEAEQYKLIAAYRLKKIEAEKRRQAEIEAKARAGEVKLAEEAAKRAEKENIAREARERIVKEKQFNQYITNADVKFNNAKRNAESKTLEKREKKQIVKLCIEAKRLYKLAIELKPSASVPKRRIKEIDEFLASFKAEAREFIAKEKEEKQAEEEAAMVKEDEEAEALRSFNEAEEAKKAEAEKNKAIKAEREKEILEALAEKERLEREKREAIIRQRKETEASAVIEKMEIEARVKTEYKPMVLIAREKEIKTSVNKEVKAQDTKQLIAMVAERKVAQKKVQYKTTTSDLSSTKDRPSIQSNIERKYRPSIQDRSQQDVSGTQWVYKFAPEIVMTQEKGFLSYIPQDIILCKKFAMPGEQYIIIRMARR